MRKSKVFIDLYGGVYYPRVAFLYNVIKDNDAGNDDCIGNSRYD